ncbi:MAG: hypothetical protein ACXWUG_22280, partial [Polyangiales bacterium]
VPPPPASKRKVPPPPAEKEEDLDVGWSAPPPSIKLSAAPPSIRLSGPPSRRSETSLPPIEVDPSWVSLHTLAPGPISVRMPTVVPAKKGPPPLPPPPKNTIPVESEWIDEEAHDDPDAAARAALLRPKGVKPPPLPRLHKK